MKTTANILTAIAAATVAFCASVPAQAGGKRLNFGYPLGSFVAKDHSGGSSRSGYSNHSARKAAARRAAARKAAARKAAARRAAAQKLAAKKAAARKIAARKAAARQVAAKKKAAQIARQRAAQKKLAERKKTAKKPLPKQIASTQPENSETETTVSRNAPVKASAIAGTNTLDFDDKTEIAAKTDVEDEIGTGAIEPEANDTDEGKVSENAQLTCKKFIPSAGLTITVPCGS